MADYAFKPVIRLPKSKTEQYNTEPINDAIVSETLFLKSFPSTINESELRQLLHQYQPIEIQLYRHNGEGYIRFRNASIADQVYALYQDHQFSNGTKLHFSVCQDTSVEAESMLLKVDNLPKYYESTALYDLFRPFGPLAICKLLLEPEDSAFHGSALIQYFYHDDCEEAIQTMHGQTVDRNKIVVESAIPNDYYQKSSLSSSSPMTPDKVSDPGYVDVMNLYIKNLDPKVTNTDLFNTFRNFGRIVSARVMTNPATNQSKGYGFVSYSRTDEARSALEQMNGKMLYSKPLVVSYHAPKKTRHTPQPSSSPEYSYQDSLLRSHRQDNINSTPNAVSTAVNGLGIDNVDQIAIDIKDLSIGQNHSTVPAFPLQRKTSITDNYMMMQQVRMSPPFSSSPMSGSTAGGRSLASLASGLSIQQPPPPPQQFNHSSSLPSSGIMRDFKQTVDGRPTLRRKSSLESISTVMTESSASIQRQKLTQAVIQCDIPFDNHNLVTEIVDMLLTLKKKERSLCLFNQDFLKSKIALALEALETFHDEEEGYDQDDEQEQVLHQMLPRQTSKKEIKPIPVPSTPPISLSTNTTVGTTLTGTSVSINNNNNNNNNNKESKREDDIPKSIPARTSKAIPIVAPPISSTNNHHQSVSNNKNILKMSTSNGLTIEQKEMIDSLITAMEGKPVHEKKQLLGDRLFPLVKATGTKQAPKVTIRLLDTVDLLELATLMFDKEALKKQVDIVNSAMKQVS